jgi:Txe/YoeB family toxin of Txe-Axe toxin-antitoxin module
MTLDADVFEAKKFYFEQVLKLIIYGYSQLKKDKAKDPYSRKEIQQIIKKVQNNPQAHFQLEDFLRNDFVATYLRRLRHCFQLSNFSIQPGVEEASQNVKTGIVDIRFENVSATTLDGTGFIFECKRLNKYAEYQKAYLEEGMLRFVNGKYDAGAYAAVAGMIAFVEVDVVKHKDGFEPVGKIATQLKRRIDSEFFLLNTTHGLSSYKFANNKVPEVSGFKYGYLSKHLRSGDKLEIDIHHLLLDYYDIIAS